MSLESLDLWRSTKRHR